MKKQTSDRSLRISFIYAIITAIYIILSDRLIASFVQDIEHQVALQTIKGLLFIAVTASLIYLLLRRELNFQERILSDLRNSEAKWRSLVEKAPDIILTVDRQAQILFTNDAPEGVSAQAVIGTSALNYVPREHHTTVRAAIDSVFETGQSTSYEIDARGPHDTLAWFSTRLAPIKHDNHIHAVILITRDVTERKLAEMTLQQALNTAQAIVEASPLAIIHLDPDGIVQSWNAAAENIFGWSADEVIGRILPYVPPDKMEEFRNLRARVMQGQGFHGIEAQRLKRDGTAIIVSISTAPMRDIEDNLIGIMAVVDDITARNAADEEIRRLNTELEQRVAQRTAQLEAANQELEAFAYSVSHDLRAPLRAIDGFSKIIEEDYGEILDAEGNRLLHVVRSSAQKMDQLISDLLSLSKATRSEMKVARIDMTSMAQSIYSEVATPQNQSLFSFSVSSLPDAYAGTTLMRQVWSNLIGNAIKYTLPKDERQIAISGWQDGDENVYCIKDTGVGFNPDYKHKLFGVFQRLHKTVEFDGTGVGLAIVQRIVHRHGGRVWAESRAGEGATFYFSLPRRAEDG